jgi:hypothetical protein
MKSGTFYFSFFSYATLTWHLDTHSGINETGWSAGYESETQKTGSRVFPVTIFTLEDRKTKTCSEKNILFWSHHMKHTY